MIASIEFKKTGYFSSLICDYLEEKPQLKRFYDKFPSIANLELQAKEKTQVYSKKNRAILVKALRQQYQNIEISEAVSNNLNILENPNTVTITTGHQLNLFSGPLYFVYKILSVVNLCEQLNHQKTDLNYVPVYWMATEDHDFLEINHFNFKGKKIQWNYEAGLENKNGYVGEFSTNGLDQVFELFEKELGVGKNAKRLKELFAKAYLQHKNLTEASRFLVNELFKDYGVIVVDGNDKILKELYIPYLKNELTTNISFQEVSKTAIALSKLDYKVQVNPREINLFYGIKGLRSRIEKQEDGSYIVVDEKISWKDFSALQVEIENYPERFSPNVLLRPLYQEVILPNIAYIGGGGELAYWFQLKEMFAQHQVPFPNLILRDSVLLVKEKTKQKLERLDISLSKLFRKQNDLINWRIRKISNISIDFSEQRKALQKQFEDLKKLATETDKSFIGSVNAQETKQLKGLKVLEKRLLKAQRRKLKDEVNRVVLLQNELFPQQSLQERKANFSEFYLEYGESFIKTLKEKLNPLDTSFKIIFMED